MFQNLRTNSQIYILHKDSNPRVETGIVASVSAPVPKFPVPPGFNPMQEMVVDVVARVNGQDITYQKLPANTDIADFGNNGQIILASSRDAMNAEIASMKQKSLDIINSIEYHKNVVTNCDQILHNLNPEYAEKQKQQEEINILRVQMNEITKTMSDLMDMNKQLLTQLKDTNNENVGN